MDRRLALCTFLLLAATGCQQNPYISSHLEILGAERRALEDRVLDLEYQLERAEKRLAAVQDDGTDEGPGPRRRDAARGNSEVDPTLSGSRNEDEDNSLQLEQPRVNPGQPVDDFLPEPRSGSAAASPRYRKPTRPVAVRDRAPGDPRITHIALNPTLTGGTDFDRQSGDDGLIVVLQPRNADDQFVPLAGPVTVVLLDYAKRDLGAEALVARWEISAQDVHRALVNDEYAQGIQLRLPWSEQPPENSKLRLDVRYTTADGRHLDARADVFVTLPGQFSTRWTPRAPGTRAGSTNTQDHQPPVNVARQPGQNESARQDRATGVIQSSLTTASRAAELRGDPPPAGDPQRRSTPAARPTWQPDRPRLHAANPRPGIEPK